MLTYYDYFIIIFYLIFLASMGFVFKRFNRGTKDYFAGGFRMSWWLLGASSFISNFSCWTFVGAANVVYTYGVLIFVAITAIDVLGFLLSVIWFAPWFRNLRLVTAMDAIRLRFGPFNEQFYNWLQMLNAFCTGAVWMVSLSVILSSTFGIPQIPIIAVTTVVIIIIAMLGGNWAVAASDFIQLLLLMSVTVVVAVLTLKKVGGIGALIHSIPADHWQVFWPLGSTQYDWLYIVLGVFAAFYQKNNIGYAAKYIAAKDTRHARWSAMVPLVGYCVFPIIWFLPSFAAISMFPDIGHYTAAHHMTLKNPGESAYILVCLQVLPQGLMGLMIAGMFSATIASMDVALNKNAGFFIKNYYLPILRKNATDRELLIAGEFATLACGVIIALLAVLLVAMPQKLNLFDAYNFLTAYLGAPLGVPMFLGTVVRRTPRWAGWSTVLVGFAVTVFLYNVLPMEMMHKVFGPVLGEGVYHYLSTNHFVTTNAIAVPLTALFFLSTQFFYKVEGNEKYVADVKEFFRRKETPVDFEKEVGGDNTPRQAQTIGTMAMIYGTFVLLLVLIPNPLAGRVGILGCAGTLLGVGGALLIYAKYGRRKQAEKDAARGNAEV